MNITVNGEAKAIEQLSVQDYLITLAIDPRRVAVELNRDILPKAQYQSTLLQEGDTLEIVHFVGGGAGTSKLDRPGRQHNPTSLKAIGDREDAKK